MKEFIKKLFSGGGQSFGTWQNISGGDRNKTELLKEYKNLVYACVSAIAEDVARYQPIIKQDGKVLKDHQVLKLLKNSGMTQYELFEATQSYIELTGEAFWLLTLGEQTGLPKSIRIIRPDVINPTVKDGELIGYAIKKKDGTEIKLDVNEVIHIKKFNPRDNWRGYGTTKAGELYIETEESTSTFQRNFLRNQATPSGVLTINGKVDTETFQKIKTKWNEAQSGLHNAGKTLFIRQADAKFEKMGLTLSDLNMEGIKKLSREDVLQMFRVPEALLGKTDSNGLGRANVEAIEYIFASRVIEPKLIRLDGVILEILKRFYKGNFEVEHVSQIPSDERFELEYNNLSINRWETVNEIRAKSGLLPIKGGDELDGTKEEVQEQKELGSVKIKSVVLEKKEEKPEELYTELQRIETKNFKKYKRNFEKLIKEQERKVLEILGKVKKGYVETSDLIQFTLVFTKEDIEKDLLSVLVRAMQDSGSLGIDLFGEPDERFVLNQAKIDSVFNQTERLMRTFNEETALKLQKQMALGMQNNETQEQILKRAKGVFSEIEEFRSERIAQTEVHQVINEGIAESYKQMGYKQMVWKTNPGACPFCREMEGKTRTIGIPFIPKGGSVETADGEVFVNDYQDVSHANLHPNCKCYLKPIETNKMAKPTIIKEVDNSKIEELEKEKKELEKKIQKLEKDLEKKVEKTIDFIIEEKIKKLDE